MHGVLASIYNIVLFPIKNVHDKFTLVVCTANI